MARRKPESKKSKLKIPKGPCEPEPPRRPPFPRPTPPWDAPSGPDPRTWLEIGTKGKKKRN